MRRLVWVVDDYADLVEHLCAILQEEGYETEAVGDWKALMLALRKAGRIERRFPNLILLDLLMPGMNGMELLPWLREIHPDLPIVVISGVGDRAIRERALAAGAVAYLDKPVEVDELLAVVERHARRP